MQSNLRKAPHPPQNAYKICVNGHYGGLEASNARLQVSVGNPRYEGAKLAAMAEFCRRRYDQTTVIVSDTLQRHNQADPFRWWAAARREGQEWLQRNRKALAGFDIVRWDSLLLEPAYAATYEEICGLTAHGRGRDALYDLALSFQARNGVPVERCLAFLREELTAFALLFKEPAVDIYAGSWISGLFEAIDHPSFKQIRCLSVDFMRK